MQNMQSICIDTSPVIAVNVVLKSKFFDVKTMIKERFTV